MRKNWKWITGILLILVILFGYWRYTKKQTFYEIVNKFTDSFKEKPFKQFKIETSNVIVNKTDKDFYDEIIVVGLEKLNIDSTFVIIKPITNQAKATFDSNVELKAHIIGKDNTYVIWVDELGRYESIGILAHELIHLVQYKTKEIIVEKDFIEWKGKKYSYDDVRNMDYFERPWEQDAFSKQNELKLKIEQFLYD